MSKKKYIDSALLVAWAKSCLMRFDFSEEHANFVSKSLVQTSLWGIDSHGIARLPHYLNRIKAGSLKPQPNIEIENSGPCSSNVNGDHGLGIVVMGDATKESISLAKKNGIGIVGIRESSHCGAIGIYGRMIAEKGLIGIVFTHSDSFVAPHRGFKKFMGTNPICITAPNADGPPVCLDMATSAKAFNYVMNARVENRKIPDNVGYDVEGNATENPHEIASLRPMAEHRGYALAFMIDLLCGPLNGMPFGLNIPSMYEDLTENRHLGSLVIAIDPMRFFGGRDLSKTVANMVKSAHYQFVKNKDEPVLAPGDDQYAKEKERLKNGIPVEAGLLEQIHNWSDELNIKLPQDFQN